MFKTKREAHNINSYALKFRRTSRVVLNINYHQLSINYFINFFVNIHVKLQITTSRKP